MSDDAATNAADALRQANALLARQAKADDDAPARDDAPSLVAPRKDDDDDDVPSVKDLHAMRQNIASLLSDFQDAAAAAEAKVDAK